MADREYKAGDILAAGSKHLPAGHLKKKFPDGLSEREANIANAVRAEVLGEINDRANELRGFDAVRMKPVERSTTQYDFWQIEVAEAFGGRLTGDTFTEALAAANRSEDGNND